MTDNIAQVIVERLCTEGVELHPRCVTNWKSGSRAYTLRNRDMLTVDVKGGVVKLTRWCDDLDGRRLVAITSHRCDVANPGMLDDLTGFAAKIR